MKKKIDKIQQYTTCIVRIEFRGINYERADYI